MFHFSSSSVSVISKTVFQPSTFNAHFHEFASICNIQSFSGSQGQEHTRQSHWTILAQVCTVRFFILHSDGKTNTRLNYKTLHSLPSLRASCLSVDSHSVVDPQTKIAKYIINVLCCRWSVCQQKHSCSKMQPSFHSVALANIFSPCFQIKYGEFAIQSK